MAAEGFPVARIDEYAKPCEPAIHVLRSVLRSHQIFDEIFTRKQLLPTSAGNAQAQLHFYG